MQTTVGQLMVNEALPESLRDYSRVLDKKGIKKLLQQIAEEHPDKYREVAKALSDVGRDVAFSSGGYSFGLQALRQSTAAKNMRAALSNELQRIYQNPGLSPEQRESKIIEVTGNYQRKLADEVMEESLRDKNPLALQALSGARGNKFNVNSLRGADLLYVDHRGQPVPLPVTRSYSMGLRPSEYFAGSFGARKGVVDLKLATQNAGYLAKQLFQAAHRLVVDSADDDKPYDAATPRGLPVDTDDPDNAGGLLAHPLGGYARNTILTPKILKELKARGFDEILIRSPTVGGPASGGVYGRDVGVREKGRIAPPGDYVGPAGAQAIAEPVTQAQISSKHSGGVAGAGAGAISGFKHINALIQAPKVFPGGAAHAQQDGTVTNVREAPQGGYYVQVDGKDHYVASGANLRVKKGDPVEAGDVLSDGTPNPYEIVRHKGIGEGRRYFVKAVKQSLIDSGTTGERRNIELLARGLINHVRLTDEVGDWAPDDVVPYQYLESQWRPRPGYFVGAPEQARGQYLEKPVLHYSVGTKIQPSMLQQLKKYNVSSIHAHKDPPPFEPEMIRGMASVAHDPDWLVRMLGSYQKDSLLEGARRGSTSSEAGSSFVPSLVRGENFGRTPLTQGWKP